MRGAGVIGSFLGPIMWYCENNEYPPLTVLVVNQETGLPGEGLSTMENVNTDREQVYNFNSFSIEPPETSNFEKVDRG